MIDGQPKEIDLKVYEKDKRAVYGDEEGTKSALDRNDLIGDAKNSIDGGRLETKSDHQQREAIEVADNNGLNKEISHPPLVQAEMIGEHDVRQPISSMVIPEHRQSHLGSNKSASSTNHSISSSSSESLNEADDVKIPSKSSNRRISIKVRKSLAAILKTVGIEVHDPEEAPVKSLWNVFDTDGDGVIDFHEFCRYASSLMERANQEGAQLRARSIRDTMRAKSWRASKDENTITTLEMKFIYLIKKELRRRTTLGSVLQYMFYKFDDNHSGKISYAEFNDGIRELGLLEYNFIVHGHKRRYAEFSLFVLDCENPLRLAVVWLIDWKWFDRFILFCIIVNSISLALRNYLDPGIIPDENGNIDPDMYNQLADGFDFVFTYIFAIECILKVIGMGLVFGRGSYLRSHWNQLDFVVVLFGAISDLPGVPKISILRSARILRPLRTLSNLKGMRMLMHALLSAIPALFNVIVILGFVFTVFGILGVLFWNGALHYRCRSTPFPVNGVWPLAGDGKLCGGEYTCPSGQYCGSVYNPPAGTSVDLENLSPFETWEYAFTNFDHIGHAVLTLFQCITLEGWTEVMYDYQDAQSWIFATSYFVVFTIIGAFFLLQFVFAVIWERFNAVSDAAGSGWHVDEENQTRLDRGGSKSCVEAKTDEENKSVKKKNAFGLSIKSNLESTMVVVNNNSAFKRFRDLCRSVAVSNRFSYFITFCILVNTLCLALEEYPSKPSEDQVREGVNSCLTFVFIFEMIIKLIGLGWQEYRQDGYNLFDGVIVCISIVEMVIDAAHPGGSTTGISALRSFRLFRVMKLARSWTSLRELVQTMINSLADVANFGLLLLLLMYVFALIGMQFFAAKYRFNEAGEFVEWQPHVYNYTSPPHAPWTPEQPYTVKRSNFDDILSSFTTVFQLLTEESWNFVMYDGIRAVGWSAMFYFIGVMIFGNIIVLNLFLAILLGNFSTAEDVVVEQATVKSGGSSQKLNERSQCPQPPAPFLHQKSYKRNAIVPQLQLLEDIKTAQLAAAPPRRNRWKRRSTARVGMYPDSVTSEGRIDDYNDTNPIHEHIASARKLNREAASKSAGVLQSYKGTTSLHTRSFAVEESTTLRSASDVRVATSRTPFYYQDRSLFLFSRSNRLRKWCGLIANHQCFEGLVLFFIAASSVQLAIDNPISDPETTISQVLATMDIMFTCAFSIEMVVKVVDMGFLLNGKRSYIRDPWNALDLLILISSVSTLFTSSKALRTLRAFRTLRALRPLRMISRVPGMKRVVNALLSSIPCIANVCLVCLLIFFIFGIIGVNLFKGRMYYCDMSSFSAERMNELEDMYGFSSLNFKKLFSKEDCLAYGGRWLRYNRNYDNLFQSVMTMFELATTEGWVDVMFQGVDATEIGYHPVENMHRGYIFFFIVFIIIGDFFTLNLVVGAVIDNFNRLRDSIVLDDDESETQREWLQIQEVIRNTKLRPKLPEPTSLFRLKCFRLTQHRRFEPFVAACVGSNTILLAMTHFRQSNMMTEIQHYGNMFFWFIFLAEAVVKFLGLGIQRYFRDRWNCFDFAVVCGSTISLVITLTTPGEVSPIANTLRGFRMGLALRLMKGAQSMQNILMTIMDNMPALINVSTLLFLLMFVYAVTGVQLFAGIRLGEALNEHANFQYFSYAMITLFRFSTGEAWNDVMYDLMVDSDSDELDMTQGGEGCVDDYDYSTLVVVRQERGDPNLTIGCTPGVTITYIYFVSYMLIASYVLLNLFVAVILEGFEETTEKNASAITKEDLSIVARLWEQFDPLATGYLSHHDFVKFAYELPLPIGPTVTNANDMMFLSRPLRRDVDRWIRQLNLVISTNGVSFNAFLVAASERLMRGIATERGEVILPPKSNDSFFSRSSRTVNRMNLLGKNGMPKASQRSLHSVIAAIRIQSVIRRAIIRRRLFGVVDATIAQVRLRRASIYSSRHSEAKSIEEDIKSAGPTTEMIPNGVTDSRTTELAASSDSKDKHAEEKKYSEDEELAKVDVPKEDDQCSGELRKTTKE